MTPAFRKMFQLYGEVSKNSTIIIIQLSGLFLFMIGSEYVKFVQDNFKVRTFAMFLSIDTISASYRIYSCVHVLCPFRITLK